MSSIHGFENSKLRYNDAPFDDAIGNDFSIPRPKVTSDHYEMRETDSDIGLLNDEEEQAKVTLYAVDIYLT